MLALTRPEILALAERLVDEYEHAEDRVCPRCNVPGWIDGCCPECGVDLETCPACNGVGYHAVGCADA